MNRIVLGALSALLLAAAGVFWWQGRAASRIGAALPTLAAPVVEETLPGETGAGMQGAAPPEVSEATKEQRRFDRIDRNRDSRITRTEALMPRVAMFRKLDRDGNNLLSFEEWAVTTTNRFTAADRNGDGILNRAEFATTKPKRKLQADCKRPARSTHRRGKQAEPVQPPAPAEPSDDVFDPPS